jgi:hypothetical protein
MCSGLRGAEIEKRLLLREERTILFSAFVPHMLQATLPVSVDCLSTLACAEEGGGTPRAELE